MLTSQTQREIWLKVYNVKERLKQQTSHLFQAVDSSANTYTYDGYDNSKSYTNGSTTATPPEMLLDTFAQEICDYLLTSAIQDYVNLSANEFIELTDTPETYTDQGGKFVKVKDDESGLEFVELSGIDVSATTSFIDLTDTPSSYSANNGKILRVNNFSNGIEFITLDTTIVPEGTNLYYTDDRVQTFGDNRYSLSAHEHDFINLNDTPSSYSAQAGKNLRVNNTEDGIEFYDLSAITEFIELIDTPESYSAQGGKFVRVNGSEDGLEFYDLSSIISGGVSNFIDLIDTPNSYSGENDKYVKVNSSGTGLEFITLNTTVVPEGTNLYYTDGRVQTFGDNRYALKVHDHEISAINGLTTALNNKQDADIDLITIASLSHTNGYFIVSNGTSWITRDLSVDDIPTLEISKINNLQTTLDGKQTKDSDLTAIAALSTTGILVRTGTNTWALRTITKSGKGINITNGNGVSGNPVISLDIGTGATQVAVGNHLHSGVYEPVITKGTTSQYFRGDMSLATFPTSLTPTAHASTHLRTGSDPIIGQQDFGLYSVSSSDSWYVGLNYGGMGIGSNTGTNRQMIAFTNAGTDDDSVMSIITSIDSGSTWLNKFKVTRSGSLIFNGVWKIITTNTDFQIQKYEGGVWVKKQRLF